jgi:hypothetical protein
MKNQIISILKSRTIMVLLFLIFFNAFTAVSSLLDPAISGVINAVFLTLAGYFRIDTKQKF